MTSLLDFPSPPAGAYGAYGAKPLAVDEIDAHPDRDRIWATIMALREVHEYAAERAYDEGWAEAVAQGATV